MDFFVNSQSVQISRFSLFRLYLLYKQHNTLNTQEHVQLNIRTNTLVQYTPDLIIHIEHIKKLDTSNNISHTNSTARQNLDHTYTRNPTNTNLPKMQNTTENNQNPSSSHTIPNIGFQAHHRYHGKTAYAISRVPPFLPSLPPKDGPSIHTCLHLTLHPLLQVL
jgi:hypothetical protein